MGYSVVGLPHYVIWHIYEPSSDDLKHMEWMAKEEARQLEESKLKQFYDKIWSEGFEDVREDWKNDRINIFKNTDTNKIKNVKVDWSDADNFQYKSPLGKDKDKVLAAFDPSS